MNRPGLLTAISAVFVVGGLLMLATPGSLLLGLMVVIFFGVCLLVGLAGLQGRRSGRTSLPAWVVVAGCAGFTVAFALLLLAALSDWGTAPAVQLVLVALLGVAGIVFFGGGGIVFALRQRTQRQGGP